MLQHLQKFFPYPWLAVGDFNEIVHQLEKYGTTLRNEKQMESFRNALEDCQQCDLGFQGPILTWSNKGGDGTFTKECLDHAVANKEWCDRHSAVEVLVMEARSSYHMPLLASFSKKTYNGRRHKQGFKFEAS